MFQCLRPNIFCKESDAYIVGRIKGKTTLSNLHGGGYKIYNVVYGQSLVYVMLAKEQFSVFFRRQGVYANIVSKWVELNTIPVRNKNEDKISSVIDIQHDLSSGLPHILRDS